MRKILSIVLFLAMATMAHQAMAGLVVTETNDGAALVSNIVGAGITVTPGSVVYSGAATASGTFTGGASAGITIPFTSQ